MGIETILATLLPAFMPTLIGIVKDIFGKITGTDPAAPKTPQDSLEMYKAETDRLRALSEIGKPFGEVSKWVNDLRASSQYIAVLFIIGSTVVFNFLPPSWYDSSTDMFMRQLCGSALFFLLGARVDIKLRKNGK